MDELKKKLKNWPMENLKVLFLFLKKDDFVTFEDVAKQLKYNPLDLDDKTGKSIGGILSTLSRNKLNDQPLIVSVGRLLGTRRMQWKVNNKVFTPEVKDQILSQIENIIKDRESL